MKLTIKDLRDLKPCYDPTRYLPEDWTGTICDLLKTEEIPGKDRLWVACREKFFSDDQLFLFAENCAWRVAHLIPEEEQLEYANILCIIRLARETCDDNLKNSARDSAWASARDSAWASARDSAWASAWASARDSARGSAWDSARAWASARASARGSARGSAFHEMCLDLATNYEVKK